MPVKTFKHTGGGCFIGEDPKKRPLPCDDMYEAEDGEKISILSTKDRHFSMPATISLPEKNELLVLQKLSLRTDYFGSLRKSLDRLEDVFSAGDITDSIYVAKKIQSTLKDLLRDLHRGL
jgi:hypothetical protein